MKLTIPTRALSTPLATLKTIAKGDKTHPINGNVALIAEKGELRLIAQDMEKRLELTLPCKTKKAGSITLPCGFLADLLSQRTDAECEISTEGNEATIRLGKHVGKRPGLPIEEMMPKHEVAGKLHKFTIPAKLLNEALTKCIVQAANVTGEKAYLNSVWLVSRDGLLNIQATDGRRLVIFYTPVPFDCGKSQFLIPRESVSALANMASDSDVEIECGDNLLTASCESVTYSTLLLEGKVMDFEKVFPPKEKQALQVTCNRELLLSEVATAATYADAAEARISIASDGKQLTINAKTLDKATGDCSLDCEGDSISFACNPDYLTDALKSIPDESVTLRFESDTKPCVIRNESVTSIVYLMKP